MIKIETKMTWRGNEVKSICSEMTNASVEQLAISAVSNAVLLAPRDSGHLAASINYQMYDRGSELGNPSNYGKGGGKTPYGFIKLDKPRILEALVGTLVFYGPHMEYGTVKTNAQAFMRPAMDMLKGNALNIIKINGKNYFAEYLNSRDVFFIANKGENNGR
jgi:hypothetical protein